MTKEELQNENEQLLAKLAEMEKQAAEANQSIIMGEASDIRPTEVEPEALAAWYQRHHAIARTVKNILIVGNEIFLDTPRGINAANNYSATIGKEVIEVPKS